MGFGSTSWTPHHPSLEEAYLQLTRGPCRFWDPHSKGGPMTTAIPVSTQVESQTPRFGSGSSFRMDQVALDPKQHLVGDGHRWGHRALHRTVGLRWTHRRQPNPRVHSSRGDQRVCRRRRRGGQCPARRVSRTGGRRRVQRSGNHYGIHHWDDPPHVPGGPTAWSRSLPRRRSSCRARCFWLPHWRASLPS